MIKENLEEVLENIKKNSDSNNTDNVQLVAVSKTKPLEMILEAHECGQKYFGENKAMELKDKYEKTKELDIEYHFIGHLQRNKVKYVVGRACLIHSLDSFRLAEKIDDEAKKKNLIVNVLVQVNIGDEESKYGINIDEAEEFIDKISRFENIRIKGLMCVAPYVVNPEENRPLFRKMSEVFIDIKDKNKDNVSMEILSMGMSNDYIVALDEGANMIRVGSAIFGNRNY